MAREEELANYVPKAHHPAGEDILTELTMKRWANLASREATPSMTIIVRAASPNQASGRLDRWCNAAPGAMKACFKRWTSLKSYLQTALIISFLEDIPIYSSVPGQMKVQPDGPTHCDNLWYFKLPLPLADQAQMFCGPTKTLRGQHKTGRIHA